jgi:hypothetical protein
MCYSQGLVFSAARGFPSPNDDRKLATYPEVLNQIRNSPQEGWKVTEVQIGARPAFRAVTLTDKVLGCSVGVDMTPNGPLLVTAGDNHSRTITANERPAMLKAVEQFCDSLEMLAK